MEERERALYKITLLYMKNEITRLEKENEALRIIVWKTLKNFIESIFKI